MSLVAERAVSPNEIAASWLLQAMNEAGVSVYELASKSHIPPQTIYGILHVKSKNSCRFDTLCMLVKTCGFTLALQKSS